MTLTLKYKATYLVNTADLLIPGDNIIEFGAYTIASPDWVLGVREFIEDDQENLNDAFKLFALAFASVGQSGEWMTITGPKDVETLRDLIEAENPGYGDDFIKHILLAHYRYHFRKIDDLQESLKKNYPQSVNGQVTKRTKSAVK